MAINIELTPKQYAALVKLVHLGNFMANSFRDEGKRLKEFDDIEQLVLSHAESAGIGRRILKDEKSDKLYLSETLEDEAHQHSNRYDDDVFWDRLIENLALRDMKEAFSKEELKEMGDGEYEDRLEELIQKYESEIDEHGVERLEIRGD